MRAIVVTTRRQQQPAIAVLAAWLCLFLQASGLAHGLLVRHSFCAEHGELIHPSEARSGSAAFAPASGKAAVEAQRSRAEAVHEHEHCAVFAHRRDALAAGAEARWVAVSPPAGQLAAALSAAQFQPPARSLLLLAPKTSPPA
jgi:hypothetical protein